MLPTLVELRVPKNPIPKHHSSYWTVHRRPHAWFQITRCEATSSASIEFACTGRIILTNSPVFSNDTQVLPFGGLFDKRSHHLGRGKFDLYHQRKKSGTRQLASASFGLDDTTWLQLTLTTQASLHPVCVVQFLRTETQAIETKQFTSDSAIFLVSWHHVESWVSEPMMETLRDEARKQLKLPVNDRR